MGTRCHDGPVTQSWDQLDDHDVEEVVRDLCAREWGVHVESFRRGPDGGVDLRADGPVPTLGVEHGEVILVQVKHYLHANLSRVVSAFEKEAKRNLHLSTHYRAVTTADLTVAGKSRIAALFGIPTTQVWGLSDLNGLLAQHPAVRELHHRLWMGDASSVSRLLHNVEHSRALSLIAKIRHEQHLWVATEALELARRTLREHGVVILVGPPGGGKTTTAMQLLVECLEREWEPLVATDRIRDAEVLRRPGKRQVIFYDDFVGSSLLGAFLEGKNEDSRLLALVEEAAVDDTLQMIFTTRTAVFNAAQAAHPRLDDRQFLYRQVFVDANELSLEDKAGILYRQTYFNLPSFLDPPIQVSQWVEAVESPGFNPRLTYLYIRNRVRMRSSGELSTQEDFVNGLIYSLADPRELWDSIWSNQLDEPDRWMLFLAVSVSTWTSVRDLLDWCMAWGINRHYANDERSWLRRLKVLDGDFVYIYSYSKIESPAIVNLANQGIRDYVLLRLSQSWKDMTEVLAQAVTFDQVRIIFALMRSSNAARIDFEMTPASRDFMREGSEGQRNDWRRLLREALLRTLFQGPYTGHPSMGGRPRRWERLPPRSSAWSAEALHIASYIGLAEDQDVIDAVVNSLLEQTRQRRGDPDEFISSFNVLTSGPDRWREREHELAAAGDSLIFDILLDGDDFIVAKRWMDVRGAGSEHLTKMREQFMRVIRSYHESDRWLKGHSPQDLDDVIESFEIAASALEFQCVRELAELRGRLESTLVANAGPNTTEHIIISALNLHSHRPSAIAAVTKVFDVCEPPIAE